MPGGPAAGLLVAAALRSRPKESFCWLAVSMADADEVIFEVENMVRPELEAFLGQHSG